MLYRFSDFELDPERYQLRRGGRPIRIEPRVLEVLAYLVRHRERTVSRAELLETVWPQEHVSESALKRTIRELRRTLEDSASRPRFLETVHGRGYVFLAEVAELADGEGEGRFAPARPASFSSSAETGATRPIETPPSHGLLVGREPEMATLVAALEDALSGRGRLVMLVGEPGIGKTRTAQALSSEAERRGGHVLWGRSVEGWRAPPYWPWVQAIRSYVEAVDPQDLFAEMGMGAADIAEIVPEVRAALPDLGTAPRLEDREQARFRLFDSVSRFLRRASKRRPLVIVLDNLHWAGQPSLRLLEVLVHELADSRILVVGTYRDIELSRNHPLLDTLGELGREGLFERVPLRGLSKSEVGSFLSQVARAVAPLPLVRAVHLQTQGNPFFLNEVAQLLVQEGVLGQGRRSAWRSLDPPPTLSLPEGIREVVGRRLNRLSNDCNRVLSMAAVVGHAFALAELERIVDELSGEAVLAAVEEAVAAGVLQEAQQTVGRYQFAHALIRETLYDELSTPRRLLQHRRIGEELEGLHARDLDSHLPQLAHHFFEAASTGVGDKAADYCARAGRQAMEMLGYEEAARFFQRALEARELCRPVDQEARCRLLLQLAQALRMGGDTRQALEAFERAASAARRIGSAEALAEAALGLGKPGGHFGLHAEPAVRLLEEALAAQPRDDSSLEVKLLSGLAAGYFLVGRFGEGKTLSRRALEMGRLVGDPSALLAALRAGLAPSDLQAEEVAEYLERTEEMLILAERLGETYALMDAHGYRAQLFLAGGRIEELRAEIEDYPRRAERLRQPAYRCLEPMHAATLATLEGRFEDAERLVVQARLEGERVRFDNVDGIFGIQMFTLRRLQGRLGEVAGAVEHFVASRQAETIWRPGLAVVLTELGQHDRARVELEALSAARFSEVPCDVLWLSSIVFLAEVTCALADREKAAVLYELIRPHGDGYVASGGIATLGAAGQYLGELAGALERWHEAERHFERALDMNRSIGARPWLALTQERYARVLGRRGASGDRERAEGLLQKALATAEEIGMAGLAPVAAAAIDALGRRPPPGHPEGLSRREVEVLRLLAAGWSNRRIAEELHISLNTVATHVRSILSKTDSVNRTEAAAYAIRCGLVEGH